MLNSGIGFLFIPTHSVDFYPGALTSKRYSVLTLTSNCNVRVFHFRDDSFKTLFFLCHIHSVFTVKCKVCLRGVGTGWNSVVSPAAGKSPQKTPPSAWKSQLVNVIQWNAHWTPIIFQTYLKVSYFILRSWKPTDWPVMTMKVNCTKWIEENSISSTDLVFRTWMHCLIWDEEESRHQNC